MDFMRLLGTVFAVLFHPASASRVNGQRICRRGTERPCYKVSYIQDSRRRLTFEDARQACRSDGGELLSIETEGEQRLVERFIAQLKAGDGDFWIGLRRNPQGHKPGTVSPGCPSQYFWLDGSRAKFRNWHWDEPSCGGEMCAVLYYQPSAPPDEEGHFLFRWNDDNCNSKNNFVCKYPEVKVPVFEERNTANTDPAPSLRPDAFATTESVKRPNVGQSETLSLSDSDSLYISYILYAAIPALLLLIFVTSGFLCYKRHTKRRKTETQSCSGRQKPWMAAAASPYSVQGPYAFSDVSKLDSSPPAHVMTKYPQASPKGPPCDDYENVPGANGESCFVTNDIYEISKSQGQRCHTQTGWVENEIYG